MSDNVNYADDISRKYHMTVWVILSVVVVLIVFIFLVMSLFMSTDSRANEQSGVVSEVELYERSQDSASFSTITRDGGFISDEMSLRLFGDDWRNKPVDEIVKSVCIVPESEWSLYMNEVTMDDVVEDQGRIIKGMLLCTEDNPKYQSTPGIEYGIEFDSEGNLSLVDLSGYMLTGEEWLKFVGER